MGGRLKLGQILTAKELISPEQLAAALGEQGRWGGRLGMTLVRMGFLEEEVLVRVLAGQLRLPVARIRGKRVNAEVLSLVPVELAEKYRCLPLFVREEGGANKLFLAMEDPSDLEAVDALSFRIGEMLRPVLVAPTELEDALARHYHAAERVGLAEASLPVRVAEPRAAEPEESETAPDLPPLDPLLDSGLGGASVATDPELSLSSVPEAPLDPNAAPALGDPPAPERPEGPEPHLLLRALAQLLVEKGVISREEFAERLRVIAARERR